MKKLSILSIVGLILALVLVSGCGSILVTKNGGSASDNIETKRYDVTDFNEIEIDSTFHYTIEQSDTYSVSVEAGIEIFDDISVTQSGQKLVVTTDFLGGHWGVIRFGMYPRIVIKMPVLAELDCSGSTDGKVTGFNNSARLSVTVSGASDLEMRSIVVPDIEIDVEGSSNVKVDLESTNVDITVSGASNLDGSLIADQLDIGISGSSDIDLLGTTRILSVKGSGASDTELDGLTVADARITLSGSSDCALMVTDHLDVDISGASSLEYIGDPALGRVDISSSSDLKKR